MSLIPCILTRSFLFGMDPEAAHDLTMDMLAKGQRTPLQWAWCQTRVDDPWNWPACAFRIGWEWPPGWTKMPACIDALGAMGFWLCGGGHRHPQAPARQPQAAHVQTARGPRTDQPPGVQQ